MPIFFFTYLIIFSIIWLLSSLEDTCEMTIRIRNNHTGHPSERESVMHKCTSSTSLTCSQEAEGHTAQEPGAHGGFRAYRQGLSPGFCSPVVRRPGYSAPSPERCVAVTSQPRMISQFSSSPHTCSLPFSPPTLAPFKGIWDF